MSKHIKVIENTLGARLRELRHESGMSQQEVADEAKVSVRVYWNWETNRNEPRISTLAQLALLFNVSLDYLCGLTTYRTVLREEVVYQIKNS